MSLSELQAHGGHFGPDTLAAINRHLPPRMMVVDGYRVRKGFSAQEQAASRRYSYYLPSIAMRGRPLGELQRILRHFEGELNVVNFMGHKGVPGGAGSGRAPQQKPPGGAARAAKFAAALEKLTQVEEQREQGGESEQQQWGAWPAGMRYDQRYRREIFSAEATTDGPDWVHISFVGRSFVLHQIRKMVASALFVLWGGRYFPQPAFEIALKGVWRIPTPVVPGEVYMKTFQWVVYVSVVYMKTNW